MPRAAGVLLLGLLAVGALTCSCEEEPGRAPESEVAEGEGKTSAVDSLSERGQGKLDHALMLLLRKGPENPFFSYQAHPREDGTVAYGVLIRTTDPSALRSAGLPVGAVPNGIAPDSAVPDGEAARPNSRDAQVVTARLTTGEIREAAGLEEVLSIANPSEAKPH